MSILTEGGAMPGVGAIHIDEIEPTLDSLEKILGIDLKNNTLGSVGKKEFSGDIDIALDIKTEDLPAFVKKLESIPMSIEIRNIHKQFGDFQALGDVSLDIHSGELIALLGPSGCGKTTLLNAIAGFHSINSGSITIDGQMLCGPGKPQATPGSDRIVVFQNGALFPWKNVLDNMMFGPVMAGKMGIKEIKEKDERGR